MNKNLDKPVNKKRKPKFLCISLMKESRELGSMIMEHHGHIYSDKNFKQTTSKNIEKISDAVR